MVRWSGSFWYGYCTPEELFELKKDPLYNVYSIYIKRGTYHLIQSSTLEWAFRQLCEYRDQDPLEFALKMIGLTLVKLDFQGNELSKHYTYQELVNRFRNNKRINRHE